MGTGRKKIEIKRKEKESDRSVTFTKRRKGLFKKAGQLHSLTGAELALLVFSPAGNPYIHPDKPLFDATINKFLGSTSSSTTITGACANSNNDDHIYWESLFNSLKVEECENLDELIQVKMGLEDIRENLVRKIHELEQDALVHARTTSCFESLRCNVDGQPLSSTSDFAEPEAYAQLINLISERSLADRDCFLQAFEF